MLADTVTVRVPSATVFPPAESVTVPVVFRVIALWPATMLYPNFLFVLPNVTPSPLLGVVAAMTNSSRLF